jgi:uncharacterized membrane protein
MEQNQNQSTFLKGHGVEKLISWLKFSVIIALLPIALNALSLGVTGQLKSFSQLVAHGELFLVATAISAMALRELFRFRSGTLIKFFKIIAGGATIVIIMLSLSYFVDILAGYLSGFSFDEQQIDIIVQMSFWSLGFAVFSGGCCILLSEY